MSINEIALTILSLKWGQKIIKFEKDNPTYINDLCAATSFMPSDTSSFTRATIITQNIHELPSCACGASVNWNKKRKAFNKYCSTKCRCNDPEFQQTQHNKLIAKYGVTNISNIPGVQSKKKKTCLSNHGVEYPQQSSTIKNKTKQSIIDKYGVDHPTKHPDIATKIKYTNIKKHGCEYPIASPDIRARIKKQNVERYGVEYSLQRTDIRNRIKATNMRLYGVEYPMMADSIKQTREQNNMVLYGVKYPNQKHLPLNMLDNHNWLYDHHITKQLSLPTIANLLSVDWSTVKRYLKKHKIDHCLYPDQANNKRIATSQSKFNYNHYNQQHITQQSMEHLNDYDWMYNEHITKKIPLYIIGQQLGCSDGTVGRYLHAHEIKTHLYQKSVGEQEVAEFLSSLNIEMDTNNRTVIPPLELDIYLPQHNLAIEYCGLYWHSEQKGKTKHYHQSKMLKCNDMGIRLITLYEDEWLTHPNLIKNKLSSIVGIYEDKKVYARNTNITSVDNDTRKQFFDNHHIQGNGLGSITYGLKHNNELVACVSFTAHKNYHILSRYATSKPIVGGFSKLLKHFTTQNNWKQIVSFADLRWSEGDVYFKTGWLLDKVIPPDYSYATSNINRYHKFNYRRKYLPHKLKNFDPNLSERENCDNNGILRIWDCGKLRFVINNN